MTKVCSWILLFIVILCLSSCSYSINVVNAEGRASDVIDEVQHNERNIEPSLNIPLS